MPQVPMYDNPTVGIAPVATPQATPLGPDAFGAGLGQGLHEVSKVLFTVAAHNDHAQVMTARNDLNQRMQDLAYNTETDPDTGQPMGYLLRKGQAATGLEQEFQADLQENLDEIRSGLQSDGQRAAFDQIAAKHIQTYQTAINEHEYKQKMAYNGELTKASVDLSLNSIAKDYQFPDLVSSHIDDGITALKSQAALNGIGPDSPVLQDQLTQYESSAHKTVIDSLIKTGQATTAMKYFNEFDNAQVEGGPVDKTSWGKRADGSDKGNGFLGVLQRPDGGVSSEISVGVNINGKETEIPTMVPTLTSDEIKYLLDTPTNQSDLFKTDTGKGILDKAVAFAKDRIAAGKSPFADDSESPSDRVITQDSVFTKQDREQILSYLKPLSDAQRVATAADIHGDRRGPHRGAYQNTNDTDYFRPCCRVFRRHHIDRCRVQGHQGRSREKDSFRRYWRHLAYHAVRNRCSDH